VSAAGKPSFRQNRGAIDFASQTSKAPSLGERRRVDRCDLKIGLPDLAMMNGSPARRFHEAGRVNVGFIDADASHFLPSWTYIGLFNLSKRPNTQGARKKRASRGSADMEACKLYRFWVCLRESACVVVVASSR
jgi:hypothetical protein